MRQVSETRAARLAAAGVRLTSTFAPETRVLNAGLAQRPKPARKASDPTAATRALVLTRDGFSCASCGGDIRGYHYSLQHRVARGAGGTSRPELRLAANFIVLCGSATSPDTCHTRVEQRGEDDRHAGYWLLRDTDGKPTDPAAVPVRHHLHGWVLLDNDGSVTATSTPDTGSPA